MAAEQGDRLCGCCGHELRRIPGKTRELAAERGGEAQLLRGLADGMSEGVTERHATTASRDADPIAFEAFRPDRQLAMMPTG